MSTQEPLDLTARHAGGATDARGAGGGAADGGLEDLDAAALEYAEQSAAAGVGERAGLREGLVRRCLPFAGRIAHRYRGRGESMEDLEQVARLGLVKAVDRYDPARGSFTAYAVITISGEIKRHFRDRTWGVHVPRRVQELLLEVGHATTALTAALARTPTPDEIAARLKVRVDEVLEALESSAGYSPASLNAPLDGDGEVGDLIGGPDGALEMVDDRLTVADLLVRLPARERRMLAMRFYGNHTQVEIAEVLGVSQMHVSRLLTRALAWLREAMLSDEPPAWPGEGSGPYRADLELSLLRDGRRAVMRVRGEVDRDTAERLRIGLRGAIGSPETDAVVVDLAGVPLIDAAGIAVLRDAAGAAAVAGVGFTLSDAQSYVAQILAFSGMPELSQPERRTA